MTNVVLIGCGSVSTRYYAPALDELAEIGEVRVVGLFDPAPSAAAAMTRHFPHAQVLRSPKALSHLSADLAVIASPPRFHAEQSIAALKAGVSVLCEKPMAISSTEGYAMIEAARTSGRTLTVNFIRRLLPAARTIRELLQTGVLGAVITFEGFEGGRFSWPVSSTAYFSRELSGGGVLTDLGSHALDLLVWWFGEPVDVSYEDDAVTGVEVNCRIRLTWPNGGTGNLMLSRDWERPNEYVIRCERGWIRWRIGTPHALEVGFDGCLHGFEAQLRVQAEDLRLRSSADIQTFERCFVEAVRLAASAGEPSADSFATGDDGLRILALVERCYRNRTFMTPPWLSDLETSRARRLALTV